ncbi:MAG: zf-HC2 domain-containing protein [Actinomycetota bacterium]
MSTWHADDAVLARYAATELDDARSASIETHLMGCATCRASLAPLVDGQRLDRVWTGIIDTVDVPEQGIVERLLVAARVPSHVARLLAATPSLRLSWFASEGFVLAFAVVAANRAAGTEGELALFLFLAIGALLPVAGIAIAFGPGIDPTYEIGVAAPMRSDRLLLLRAGAVLTTSIAITSIAALALPGLDAVAAAWLLPSLGSAMGLLALGTVLRPLIAAISVGVTWLTFAAIAAASAHDRLAAFRPAGQVLSVVVIVVSALVLVRRHSTYEEGIAP